MSKNIYDVFAGTDWALLREQKQWLNAMWMDAPKAMTFREGLVNWIDAVQDAAVDEGVASAAEVFGIEEGL